MVVMIETAYRRWTVRTGSDRADLARILGTSYDQLGRWLRGEVTPRASSLRALALQLGVDPEAMLEEYMRIEAARPRADGGVP